MVLILKSPPLFLISPDSGFNFLVRRLSLSAARRSNLGTSAGTACGAECTHSTNASSRSYADRPVATARSTTPTGNWERAAATTDSRRCDPNRTKKARLSFALCFQCCVELSQRKFGDAARFSFAEPVAFSRCHHNRRGTNCRNS